MGIKPCTLIRQLLSFFWHPIFIPWRHFPLNCINWIKEELSNDGKAFIIPWDLLKPVSIKLKERYGETTKTGLLN